MKQKSEAEICSSVSRNKKAKSLIEKRRRARINGCLEELKSIVVKSKKESVTVSKLEKADILEMTLHYLRDFQNKGMSGKPSGSRDYLEGYTACANTVISFFEKNKTTENQPKSESQIEALQAWMAQQRRKAGMPDILTDDCRKNTKETNNSSHSADTIDDQFSHGTREANQSVNGLNRCTDPSNSNDQVSTSKICSQFIHPHPQQHTCLDAKISTGFDSEKNGNKVRDASHMLLVSSSPVDPLCYQQKDEELKTPLESDGSVYQVAFLAPSVFKNQRSLIPLYGVIIPDTNSTGKHTALFGKKDQNFDGVNDESLPQEPSNARVPSDNSFYYSCCNVNEIQENAYNTGYKHQFSASICTDINNNNSFIQENIPRKSTIAKHNICDTSVVSESTRVSECCSLTERNNYSDFKYQGSNINLFSGPSVIWRPW